jgi:hypothetical protein
MPRRISTFATLQHAGRDKAAKRLIVTLVSFAALFHGVDAHLASYLPLDPAMEFARSEGLKERWGSLRRIEAAMEPKGWRGECRMGRVARRNLTPGRSQIRA